jgi:hypothetical protein
MGGLSSTGFSSKRDYLARVPAIVIVTKTNHCRLSSVLFLPKGLFLFFVVLQIHLPCPHQRRAMHNLSCLRQRFI